MLAILSSPVKMIEPDLEIDGRITEQRLLTDRARRRQQDQKNKELIDLQTVHQCKKGLFCLVKQATLRYESLPGKEPTIAVKVCR